MVTDNQVRRLWMLLQKGHTLQQSADKTSMDPKTARKYRDLKLLPSQCAAEHDWRTRPDPFDEVWPWVEEQLRLNARLRSKTLFNALQREHSGRFADGQLRTLQRRIKVWRGLNGPAREVFFAQVHRPGVLCQSDFTRTGTLGVTIAGQPFDHLLYHFVLTYSNWETVSICQSESFESLSAGLQNALWELGGVPAEHRTDQLTAAVTNLGSCEEFTQRYDALMKHYGLHPQKTQAGHGNENGDVEQRHYRFKDALDQALMLRGSRDFADRAEYEAFLRKLLEQLNAGRRERLADELAQLRRLPERRLEDCKRLKVRVDSGSFIHVLNNAYSVHSRLIGLTVEARLYAGHVEVWLGQHKIEQLPRLRGRGKHRLEYRHIIDWLVRKPGAFANYRYRDELFPTSRFRTAWDELRRTHRSREDKDYLAILHLAAREGELATDAALRSLLDAGETISPERVAAIVRSAREIPPPTQVDVAPPDLALYDGLLDASHDDERPHEAEVA